MNSTGCEEILEAIDEVLAYSSIFDHHMEIDDLLRNLRIKSSHSNLISVIGASSHLVLEGGIVFSSKYPKNLNQTYSKELAVKNLEETKEVLSILNSCRHITGLAITGSVAAGVNAKDGDVDVLIITKPGWVWRIRALAIYLSHKHPRGNLLCPNMVMSEDSLEFEEGVYSAREMMQIIPIKDGGGLTELYAKNTWAEDILPNASRKTAITLDKIRQYPWWWKVMGLPFLGNIIESWESSRRIKQLSTLSQSTEAFYSKSVCRGHENSHKSRIEAEYSNVIEAIK
ncbi:MAG: nucleotidyltransferase domain-containing protein [Candidatus Poseidoniales archaeon]|jgi:predicted nucleotidyltransferase|tara:strand:+ start:151 stop:1005 length:855 start_codon:yes stop_codon:yes gene_type:complete